MEFWRISRHRDLRGTGGLRAAGRWHLAGNPVVYLAENPAAALLEVCVHTAANDVPADFVLLRVGGPDVPVSTIRREELPEDWSARIDLTQKMGSDWLRCADTALLRVPSAIVPHTWNVLLNPLHEPARAFRIAETFTYPFDLRLKR